MRIKKRGVASAILILVGATVVFIAGPMALSTLFELGAASSRYAQHKSRVYNPTP